MLCRLAAGAQHLPRRARQNESALPSTALLSRHAVRVCDVPAARPVEYSRVSCAMCLQPARVDPLHSTPLCRAAAAPTCRRSAHSSESRAMSRSHPRMISFLDAWQTIRVFSCTCPCVLWHSSRVRRSRDGLTRCAPLAHPPLGISRGISTSLKYNGDRCAASIHGQAGVLCALHPKATPRATCGHKLDIFKVMR